MRQASRAWPWVLVALAAPLPVFAEPSVHRHWSLSVSDVVVSEESCGPHAAVFAVRLLGHHHLPPHGVTVDYGTADGTAVAGVDYTSVSGTLTFTPPARSLTVTVPVIDALVPGPAKTFTLKLSNARGAVIARPIGTATLQPPSVAKCATCGLSCDDGAACTADSCSASLGCRNVDVNACATPVCGLGTCGVDGDGDGFSDLQEDNGYIDLDCNGQLDAGVDFEFPVARPHVFSAVSQTGTGSGKVFPTVSDPTQPIATSSVEVTIVAGGGVNAAAFTYRVDGGDPIGPLTARPVMDIAGNLRLMFYLVFAPGDRFSFTTSMGTGAAVADKQRPNIYMQYDSMGWDAPGASCVTDDDCINAGVPNFQPNQVCHEGFCNHDHAPGDPLFRKVVEPFAAHGITLYVDPVHGTVPHAQVVTWARAGESGAEAACAGWDVVGGDIGNGGAVSFFDIKYRPGSDFALDPNRKNVYHYSVFGHFATCLTDDPLGTIGVCWACPADRGTPPGRPNSSMSGIGEIPGNDFIHSMGASFFNPLGSVPRNPFSEGGVFMHELGHNLGLHHLGDNANYDLAPNYLSVMNNKYVFSGIQHSAAPGSAVAVESLRELDYSEHTLATVSEPHLDEGAGVSPLTSGYTGIVRFFNFSGGNASGPESGPINWDGVPAQACAGDGDCACGAACPFLTGTCLPSGFCEVQVDLNKVTGATETMAGYRDWDHTAGPTGAGGGACVTSGDCRINAIRQFFHDLDPTVDSHEPCLDGVCQSLWLASQCTHWSMPDVRPEGARN